MAGWNFDLCTREAEQKRIQRLSLALRLLLADHGGMDDVVDVLENDAAEQRAAGLPYEREQALIDALLAVQRNRDLEVPDDTQTEG